MSCHDIRVVYNLEICIELDDVTIHDAKSCCELIETCKKAFPQNTHSTTFNSWIAKTDSQQPWYQLFVNGAHLYEIITHNYTNDRRLILDFRDTTKPSPNSSPLHISRNIHVTSSPSHPTSSPLSPSSMGTLVRKKSLEESLDHCDNEFDVVAQLSFTEINEDPELAGSIIILHKSLFDTNVIAVSGTHLLMYIEHEIQKGHDIRSIKYPIQSRNQVSYDIALVPYVWSQLVSTAVSPRLSQAFRNLFSTSVIHYQSRDDLIQELQHSHSDLWTRLLVFISDLYNHQDGMARIKEYSPMSEYPVTCLNLFYFSYTEQHQLAKFPALYNQNLADLIYEKMGQTEQTTVSVCVKRELAPIYLATFKLQPLFFEKSDFKNIKNTVLKRLHKNIKLQLKKQQHDDQKHNRSRAPSATTTATATSLQFTSSRVEQDLLNSDQKFQDLKAEYKASGEKHNSKQYHEMKKRAKKLLKRQNISPRFTSSPSSTSSPTSTSTTPTAQPSQPGSPHVSEHSAPVSSPTGLLPEQSITVMYMTLSPQDQAQVQAFIRSLSRNFVV